jgi:predicted Zn-dependent peptidase
MAALAQQPVSTVEFERAKAQVRSAVLMGLESRMTQLEDLADQLVHRSEEMLESPAEVCALIDAVQPEDLTRVARSIISGGRPSIVAYGPLKKMPAYDTILQWASRLL